MFFTILNNEEMNMNKNIRNQQSKNKYFFHLLFYLSKTNFSYSLLKKTIKWNILTI